MFRTILVTFFWILQVKFSTSAPPNKNVVTHSVVSYEPHPYLTGAKFLPFKNTRPEDLYKFESAASIKDALAPIPTIKDALPFYANGKNKNPPSNSSQIRGQSTSANFESKKLSTKDQTRIFLGSSVKNATYSTPLVGAVVLRDENSDLAVKFANAVNLPTVDVLELSKAIASEGGRLVSANVLPIQEKEFDNLQNSDAVSIISSALRSVLPVSVGQVVRQVDARKSRNRPPIPVVDSKVTISRKLLPPDSSVFDFEEYSLGQAIERNNVQRETSQQNAQPTSVNQQINEKPVPNIKPITVTEGKLLGPIQVPSDQPIFVPDETLVAPVQVPDGKLIPVPDGTIAAPVPEGKLTASETNERLISVPAAKPQPELANLPVELQPPQENSAAEIVPANFYTSQATPTTQNASNFENLPLVFQRIAEPRLPKDHSPKKDVEVFAPLMPNTPAGVPPPPSNQPGWPPLAFPSNGEPYPLPDLNDYPTYPFLPQQPPVNRVPQPPLLPPTPRSDENTTRGTEETTPKTPKSTPTVPKFGPWVPNNNPFIPNPRWVPNAPWVPNVPSYTPSQNPYFPSSDDHAWTTRFLPMYPYNGQLSKEVSSAIRPAITSRPTVKYPKNANQIETVTPFKERVISATSTAATPAVQILGEPAPVEPKYKLAVVSDYKNYDNRDGTFGFNIDLENGLTAKVRGYKKNGRHVIEGSYSLFAKEGDPVNITYVADNEVPVPETQQVTEIQTTDTEPVIDTTINPPI